MTEPTADFDWDALDVGVEECSITLEPLEPDANKNGLLMLQSLLAWAGGDTFRCSVLQRLIGQDERPISRIARDAYLDRHKVRRAYLAGLETLQAMRSARKKSLMGKGSAGI